MSEASLDIKSNGSNMTCVVPLRQGVFSSYRTLPLRVIESRFVETAGRVIQRHKRSNLAPSLALVATPACSKCQYPEDTRLGAKAGVCVIDPAKRFAAFSVHHPHRNLQACGAAGILRMTPGSFQRRPGPVPVGNRAGSASCRS